MKKTNKLIIGGLGLVLGSMLLSSCTKSFCTVEDTAHIMYMYDYGITEYYDSNVEGSNQLFEGNANIYVKYTALSSLNEKSGIATANASADKNGSPKPSLEFWKALDDVVLEKALEKASFDKTTVSYNDLFQSLNKYGYLKFADSAENKTIFANFDAYVTDASKKVGVDDCPTQDYLKDYKTALTSAVNGARSCFAIEEREYGYYGYDSGIKGFRETPSAVTMTKKTWGSAWKQGLFQGLLVFPIAWTLESFVSLFSGGDPAALQHGIPQILAILAITFIVRGLWLLATFKNTKATAKMQLLQPEIAKIQAKYPNSNTNNNDKQRMAMEMQAMYKKHGVNPLGSIIIMFFQFPIFICVLGAIQGSASISTGAFLGLNFNSSIFTTLFNGANWANGSAFTALVVFLLMAGTQVLAMFLPRILQKKQTKNIAKLGTNPAMKANESKTRMFTIIMMSMIIIMGFTLVSAMGIYWIVGALFQICQTLITNAVSNRKKKTK